MKTGIRIVLAIFILASLFFFIRATDLWGAINSIHSIGYSFILLLAVTFSAYWCGTLSWKYCMGNSSANISSGHLFLIRHIGETVSLINPASIIVGETVKVLLLQELRVEKSKAIASILISRSILVITQLFLFIAVVLILTAGNQDFHLDRPTRAILLYSITGFILIAAPVLICRRWWIKTLLKTRGGLWLQRYTMGWRLKINEVLSETSFLLKNHREQMLLALIFAVLHWILGSLEFFFILKLLGIKITVVKALLVDMGVVFFKSAGAFIPGQLGIEEYGNKIMLAVVGISGASVWITASILRRSRQLIWILFGVVVYVVMVKKRKLRY